MATSCLRLDVLLVVGVIAATPGVLRGQQSTATGTAVHMVVTVEARHGSDVPAIQKEDVMVYQGRDRVKTVDWIPLQGDRAALELFLLLDDAAGSSLGSQLEDLRKFINAQPATTRIGVGYMRDGTVQIVQNLTEDHNQAAKALRLPIGIAGVNASPYFSVSDLIKRWPEAPVRREIVMISDGIDRYGPGGSSDPYVDEAVEQAQQGGHSHLLHLHPGCRSFRPHFLAYQLGSELSLPAFRRNWRRVLLSGFGSSRVVLPVPG